MEFRIQDILKNIIPGSILTFAFFINMCVFDLINPKSFFEDYIKDAGEIWLIILLSFSYLMGYFLDAISSTIEHSVYKLITKPSFILLNNKSERYKLTDISAIITSLGFPSNSSFTKLEATKIFKKANFQKDKNPSDLIKGKVNEYYNSYIFSRNLIPASIALLVTINFSLKDSLQPFQFWSIIIVSILIFIVLCKRWREKTICYTRQVFYASHFSLTT